jgi:hypothetical protein
MSSVDAERTSKYPALLEAGVIETVHVRGARQNLESVRLALHYIADVVILQRIVLTHVGRYLCKPAHDLVIFGRKHRAGHVKQPAAWRQQRP